MKNIEHFILTPFGVGVTDHLWFLYRIELIENIVIPSLKGQTNQDFRWCLIIGENTPKIIKIKLERLMAKMSNMEIHEIKSWSDRLDFSRNICQLSRAEYIIQTRIDDDDALNVMAIEKIRGCVEQAIERNYDLGAIGIDGGFDYLCENRVIAPNVANNLTIGLTVFHSSDKNIGIFDIKHDDILVHYGRIGFATSIKFDAGGYLYTKHPLCDSSYFGMTWRVTRSSQKTEKQSNDNFWSYFGLSKNNVEVLSNVFSESPISFPSKAISLSAEKDSKSSIDNFLDIRNASKKMENLLRYKINRGMVSVLSVGEFSKKIAEKLFESKSLSGAYYNCGLEDVIGEANRFDIVIVDELEMSSQILEFGFDVVIKRVKHLEVLSDYIFIVRCNISDRAFEYNNSDVNRVLKLLYKAQDIGGWSFASNVPSEIDRVLTLTKNQLLANI